MDPDEEICYDCLNLDLDRSPFAAVSTINGIPRREATVSVPFGDYKPHTKNCGYCALIKSAIIACVPQYSGRPNAYLHLANITMVAGEPLLLTLEDWSRRGEGAGAGDGGRSRRDECARFGVEVFRDEVMGVPELRWLGSVKVLESGRARWVDFVKRNLVECETKHDQCRRLTGGKLPTRILDLGGRESDDVGPDDKADLRLVCTSADQIDRYVALSHCWGRDGIAFTLKEDLFEKFQENIRFADLPATHQDAVIATRQLGVRFLWIDSMCIIQDNEADTQRETAVMGDIYANAYLTIAAVSSENSKVPFLQTRATEYPTHKIEFQGPRTRSSLRSLLGKMSSSSQHSKATLYARRTQRAVSGGPDSASRTMAAGISDAVIGPLSKRAWTLQERALATRVVHFTAEGLRFECAAHFKTDDGRTSTPGYLSRWQHLEGSDKTRNVGPEVARDELQRFWRRILSDYTPRCISRRSDVLPALSGLAARIQKIHGADYAAGLWRDRLVEDMCWSVHSVTRLFYEALPVRKDEAALPSWSWVSAPSPSVYPLIDEQGGFVSQCEVLACRTTLAGIGLNPFGQVESGELLLRGPVRKAMLRAYGTRSFDIDFGLGNNIKMEADARLTCESSDGNDSGDKYWRRAIEGEKVTTGEAEVLCLKLGTWDPVWSTTRLSSTSLGFIMVLGRSARVQGAFERLGLLEKGYGAKKFDDVEGTVGLMRQIDEFHARTAKITGVNLTDSRPKSHTDWLEKIKEEPAYPGAEMMEVRIV